jgi:hypothetical protein
MSSDSDPIDPDSLMSIPKFAFGFISFPIVCRGPISSEIEKYFENKLKSEHS